MAVWAAPATAMAAPAAGDMVEAIAASASAFTNELPLVSSEDPTERARWTGRPAKRGLTRRRSLY